MAAEETDNEILMYQYERRKYRKLNMTNDGNNENEMMTQ